MLSLVLSLSIYIYIYTHTCVHLCGPSLSVACLSLSLSLSISPRFSFSGSICRSVYASIHLSVHPSIYPLLLTSLWEGPIKVCQSRLPSCCAGKGSIIEFSRSRSHELGQRSSLSFTALWHPLPNVPPNTNTSLKYDGQGVWVFYFPGAFWTEVLQQEGRACVRTYAWNVRSGKGFSKKPSGWKNKQ